MHRRYFDVVLETGENAVVYRDDETARGSRSAREPFSAEVAADLVREPCRRGVCRFRTVRAAARRRPERRGGHPAATRRRSRLGPSTTVSSPAVNVDLALEHEERVRVVRMACAAATTSVSLERRSRSRRSCSRSARISVRWPSPRECSSTASAGRRLYDRARARGDRTGVYVELHAHSAYSFLDGASLPEELAARAAELGYDALALTDHDGVYGSLEFAHAAKHFGVRAITGAEVTLAGGAHVTLLCETQRGYANLCRHPHRRARADARAGQGARSCCRRRRRSTSLAAARRRARLPLRLRAARPRRRRPERRRAARARVRAARSTSSSSGRTSAATRAATPAQELAATLGVPTVATGDVHAHHPRRARLQDALVAIAQPHLARRLRARAARQPRIRPALAGRDAASGCRATRRRRARARSPTAARST